VVVSHQFQSDGSPEMKANLDAASKTTHIYSKIENEILHHQRHQQSYLQKKIQMTCEKKKHHMKPHVKRNLINSLLFFYNNINRHPKAHAKAIKV
jgi:hypothetical protein